MKERALRFVNKQNNSKYIIKNTIQNMSKRFWKTIKNDPQRKIFEEGDIIKSCQAIKNNQVKCGNY